MLNWKRPQDMPNTEPTEERIWAIIEAKDPDYSASTNDRSFWYHEMLEERNIYGNAFSRSPRMLPVDLELPARHNPTDWVINMDLRHSDEAPVRKIIDRISRGRQDVLQPVIDKPLPQGVVNLLSYQILEQKAKDWDPKSVFGTPLSEVRGYTEWGRYHLRVHHKVLKRAGVYKAIYASLFDYSRLPFTWIRGIAEMWDKETNTCWMGPHEMTITLADIQDVSGLPIWGTPFEECIPPDTELFRRQHFEQHRRGRYVYPAGLHRALSHFKAMDRRRKHNKDLSITLERWAKSFLRNDKHSAPYARINDPFDFGEQASEISFKERFEPEGVNIWNILAQDIDEEMSLIAFIATWLCYFVLPGKNKSFRPSTLLMASLIAQGERIALAPAVLAYIYRGLGRVSVKTDSRIYDVEAPWHYLHAWIFEHISGSFTLSDAPFYFEKERYPLIMQLNNATSAMNKAEIRAFLFSPARMGDRFTIIHRSRFLNLQEQSYGKRFEDGLTEQNIPLLLSKANYLDVAEYLISIRPAWLCYRRHDSIVLEGYGPNRVARQFGCTQATPLYGLPKILDIDNTEALGKIPITIRLKVAAQAWAFLFRMGTGSHFYITPRGTNSGISHAMLRWVKQTFSSFFDRGFKVYESKLQRPRHANYSSSGKKSEMNKDEKHKRDRESTSSHKEHRDDREEQAHKKKRSDSPTDSQKIAQSEPIVISEESEKDNMLWDESLLTPEEPIQNEFLPLQHEKLEPAQVQNEPLLIPENVVLLFGNENQSESLMLPEEPEKENLQVTNFDEEMANILALVHYPSHSQEERPVLQPEGSESTSKVSGAATPSLMHYLISSDVNDSMDECAVTATTEGSSCSEFAQQKDGNTLGEPVMVTVNELVEVEAHQLVNSELEKAGFVSNIRTRTAISSKVRFPKNLDNIIITLRQFVLGINMETLPTATEFQEVVNPLLDCAVVSGINAEDLQQWECRLREVEKRLHLIENEQYGISLKKKEDAEVVLQKVSGKVAALQGQLQEKVNTTQKCEEKISGIEAEILGTSTKIEKLQLLIEFLSQKRESLNQTVTMLRRDNSEREVQMLELKWELSPLEPELETASQVLQEAQEEYDSKIALINAAFAIIKKIQSEFI